MPTDKPQLSIALTEEDYNWVVEEADRAGIAKSGVLRQALTLYQATGGLLGPVRMEMVKQIYAEAPDDTVEEPDDTVDESDESDEENSCLSGFQRES